MSCVTQGRTLAAARKRIREALAAYLGSEKRAAAAELVENFVLPGATRKFVSKAAQARLVFQSAARATAAASELAAKELAKAGVSRRDAAEILGLSAQRVQQLVGKTG